MRVSLCISASIKDAKNPHENYAIAVLNVRCYIKEVFVDSLTIYILDFLIISKKGLQFCAFIR